MKHTRLPWYSSYDGVTGPEGVLIARVEWRSARGPHASYHMEGGEEFANTDFIVRACNNHYALVDALETAQAALAEATGNDAPDWCEIGIAESYIKSVLDSVKVNIGAA